MAASAIVTIFDLDGVLVDNVAFEHAVTDCIVAELACRRKIRDDEARGVWHKQLEKSAGHARWFDYAFHCEALGLEEVYREAHWASGHTLNVCEGIEAAVELAKKHGECWIATDASGWVTAFKLQTLRIPAYLFSEIFDSTNCRAHKGMPEYWRAVHGMLSARQAHGILIDNRSDRLSAAQAVIKSLDCILVDAEDHIVTSKFRRKGEYKAIRRAKLFESLKKKLLENCE